MSTRHRFSSILSQTIPVVVALLLLTALVLPFSSAQAAAGLVDSSGAFDPAVRPLPVAYQLELQASGTQQTNLSTAEGLTVTVQDLITQAQAKGLDTTAISTALATFQSQLTTAEASHASAATLLATHAGFDDTGSVTDFVTATQTVTQAGAALQAAHAILVQSTRDFFKAVKVWIKANQILTQIDALQVAFANQQDWLTGQQANLSKADAVVTDLQALTSAAQAQGLNVDQLSKALTAFQAKLTDAHSQHANAAALLTSHAGFDDSGKVTDSAAAAATVHAAGQTLENAHTDLAKSSTKLLAALDKWKMINHINSTSPLFAYFSQSRAAVFELFNSVHVELGAQFPSLKTRLYNLLQALLDELS